MSAVAWDTGYFLIELMSYVLSFLCIMKVKVRKVYLFPVFLGVALGIHLVWTVVFKITSFNLAAVIGSTFPLFCKKKLDRQILFFYIVILLSGSLCYGISFSFISKLVRASVIAEFDEICKMCCFILFPICIVLYVVGRKKMQIDFFHFRLLKEQKIIIFIALFCGIIGIALYELMDKNNLNIHKRMIFSELCFIVLFFIFIISIIWQGRVIWTNQELEKRQMVYEYVTKNQQQHLDDIVKKDHEFRKFRHDIKAHMIILKDLAEKEDKEGVLQYLQEMSLYTQRGESKIYSGNSIVDAIFNELMIKIDKLNIQFHLDGQLYIEDRNRAFDIAICIYNIMMNAIESLEKIDGTRNVDVCIEQFQKKVYIQVKNQCLLPDGVLTIDDLETQKEDKKNHGIGSRNVLEIVEKNDGKIDYQVKNGWFVVELLI